MMPCPSVQDILTALDSGSSDHPLLLHAATCEECRDLFAAVKAARLIGASDLEPPRTPGCLEPEQIAILLEGGALGDEAALSHCAHCAHCARALVEAHAAVFALMEAERFESLAAPKPARTRRLVLAGALAASVAAISIAAWTMLRVSDPFVESIEDRPEVFADLLTQTWPQDPAGNALTGTVAPSAARFASLAIRGAQLETDRLSGRGRSTRAERSAARRDVAREIDSLAGSIDRCRRAAVELGRLIARLRAREALIRRGRTAPADDAYAPLAEEVARCPSELIDPVRRRQLVDRLTSAGSLTPEVAADTLSEPAFRELPSATGILEWLERIKDPVQAQCEDIRIDRRETCMSACGTWPIGQECSAIRRFGPRVLNIIREARTREQDLELLAREMGFSEDESHRLALYLEAEHLVPVELPPLDAAGRRDLDRANELYARSIELVEQRGEYYAGHDAILESLELRRRLLGPKHLHTVEAELALSVALSRLSEPEGAWNTAVRAWEMARSFDERHPLRARILLRLERFAAFEGARRMFEESVEVLSEVMGPNHPWTGQAMLRLGTMNRHLGNHSQASAQLLSALDILARTLGPRSAPAADALNALTPLVLGGERAETRLGLYQRVLEMRRHPEGQRARLDQAFLNLAMAQSQLGRFAEARDNYEEARALRAEIFGATNAHALAPVRWRAELDWADGRREEALAGFVAASQPLWEQTVGESAHADADLDLLDSLDLLRRVWGHVDWALATSTSKDGVTAAFEIVLNWQGLALRLDEFRGDLRAAAGEAGPAARADLDTYHELLYRLRFLDTRPVNQYPGGAPQRSAELAAAKQAMSEVEERLSRTLQSFRRRRAPRYSRAREICRPLARAHASLVDFVHYRRPDPESGPRAGRPGTITHSPHYAAFVSDSGCNIRRVELGAASEIDAAVKRHRDALRACSSCLRSRPVALCAAKLDDIEAALREIRRRVWDPLQVSATPPRVWIIGDGALLQIPFDALPGEQRGYLIDEFELGYLPFPAALVEAIPESDDVEGAFVVGDVDYDRAADHRDAPTHWDSCSKGKCFDAHPKSDLRLAMKGELGPPSCAYRTTWAALPRGEEVDVARTLALVSNESVTVARGAHAVESQIISAMKGKRIVHLSTHGFRADEARCGAEDPIWFELPASARARSFGALDRKLDPLRFPALVLAGANRARGRPWDQDGYLSAREINETRLWGTELVVLSACDTLLGHVVDDEGVLGLARAFFASGVREVVVSLWEVPAGETADIFDTFYRLRPAASIEALRRAKARVARLARERYGTESTSFFWGGLVPLRAGLGGRG